MSTVCAIRVLKISKCQGFFPEFAVRIIYAYLMAFTDTQSLQTHFMKLQYIWLNIVCELKLFTNLFDNILSSVVLPFCRIPCSMWLSFNKYIHVYTQTVYTVICFIFVVKIFLYTENVQKYFTWIHFTKKIFPTLVGSVLHTSIFRIAAAHNYMWPLTQQAITFSPAISSAAHGVISSIKCPPHATCKIIFVQFGLS